MSGVIVSNEPTVAVKSTASNEMVNIYVYCLFISHLLLKAKVIVLVLGIVSSGICINKIISDFNSFVRYILRESLVTSSYWGCSII